MAKVFVVTAEELDQLVDLLELTKLRKQDRPKISAKLSQCKCGGSPIAHVDTSGMWGAECHRCNAVFLGEDLLGCETWQELVREWNARAK